MAYNLKRFGFLMMLVLMLAACGGGDEVESQALPTAAATLEAPSDTIPLPDDTQGGGSATVTPIPPDAPARATVTPVVEDSAGGARPTVTSDPNEMPLSGG